MRNTRRSGEPNVLRFAAIVLDAGAHGIAVHPRPDQRHIRANDVDELAKLLATYPSAEYCIEGNPFYGLIEHCLRVRPTQALLVPDEHTALTSDHGWNLLTLDPATRRGLVNAINSLHAAGIRVSVFVDPLPEVMPIVRELGAERVKLSSELYAATPSNGDAQRALEQYANAALAARDCDLGVTAGHDLNLETLPAFLQGVGRVDEVSVGHALVADALELGMAEATRRYLLACRG